MLFYLLPNWNGLKPSSWRIFSVLFIFHIGSLRECSTPGSPQSKIYHFLGSIFKILFGILAWLLKREQRGDQFFLTRAGKWLQVPSHPWDTKPESSWRSDVVLGCVVTTPKAKAGHWYEAGYANPVLLSWEIAWQNNVTQPFYNQQGGNSAEGRAEGGWELKCFRLSYREEVCLIYYSHCLIWKFNVLGVPALHRSVTVIKPQAMTVWKILEKFLGISNGCVAKLWPIFQSLVCIWYPWSPTE